MRRRSGQSGQIVRKGKTWHVRFYVDVPGQRKRLRKSVPVGPAVGKERLTKPEAVRKAGGDRPSQLASIPQNTWSRRSVPNGSRRSDSASSGAAGTTRRGRMENPARSRRWKAISPSTSSPGSARCRVESIDETVVQEFVADLKRSTFERRKPNGTLIKTYRLSRKTVLNIVGVVKLVVGRKVWMSWELDLGKPSRPKQRYFTQEQLKQIIEAAPGQLPGPVRLARRHGHADRGGGGPASRRPRSRQRGDLRAAISLERTGARAEDGERRA